MAGKQTMKQVGTGREKELKIAYIGGGSRGWAWGLMKDDPQLGSVSLEDGRKLFDDMLEAQRDYLPGKWFD